MNLTDLTAELDARAEHAPASAAVQRLAGVRQRIQARRRRRAAGAAGLAALGIAAALLVPGLADRRALPEPATTPNPSPSATDPLAFVRDLAGDPLVATATSEPGQTTLELRFTPRDTNLSFTSFCRLPDVRFSDSGRSDVTADTTVNGHELSRSHDCSADDSAGESVISYGEAAKESRARWAERGVRPGRESVLRMTVKLPKNRSVDVSRLRTGLALYELSGARVTTGGFTLKTLADSDGHRYRLAGYRSGPIRAEGPQMSLSVPAGRYPALVLAGSEVPADVSADLSQQLLVDGAGQSSISGGGTSTGPLDDAKAHTVTVKFDAGITGTMVLACYTRTD